MAVALTGCGRFAANHSNDPQSCRERAAYRLASSYPTPADLGIAVAIVCDGLVPDHAQDTTTVAPTTTISP